MTKMATEFRTPSGDEIRAKVDGLVYKIRPVHSEINLVPDVKNDAIKAIKARNLTFFICIIVASVSFAITAIFASIAFGQQAVTNGNKETIATLSKKLFSYSDLSNFLTIKDQLSNLSAISQNKILLSRAFNILSATIPSGPDTIAVSEFSINFTGTAPTITFDAQANAGQPPYIDYNVLEAFKKSMAYLRYDYGNYVDREGKTIPTYCIIEYDLDGTILSDSSKGVYAYWLINGEGCNPSAEQNNDTESSENNIAANTTTGYETENYNGQTVVRIWRTPQFNDWYKDSAPENNAEPYMDLSGNISGVAHFVSKCTTYSGVKNAATGSVDWKSENESCLLIPGGENGLKIGSSSNGRDGAGELVLRFSAIITINQEFFKFVNPHMLAVAPSDRRNVTDSYIQIQNIFGAPASDCAANDAQCNNGNGENDG
jgi:hypothetical protein